MKKRNFQFGKLAFLATVFALTSCTKDDNGANNSTNVVNGQDMTFNIGYGVGYSGTAQGTILPTSLEGLKSGEISFVNNGYKLEDSRTHRLYSTNNGKTIYFLSYLKNEIEKYHTTGDQNFYKKDNAVLSVNSFLGTTQARWNVIDEKTALVYGITPKHEKDASGTYVKTVGELGIAIIDLENMVLKTVKTHTLEVQNASVQNEHIWRIDQPVVHQGKVYIGTSKRGYDPLTNKNISGNGYKTSTLVLDFPSLENPKIIDSGKGKGEGYGFRTPCYLSYDGSVYHINMTNSKILKITNGVYDDSYDFDLATALNITQVGASGLFYVNNGIAYATLYDSSNGQGGTDKPTWTIARIDLKNKTAIKMNVPSGMWLRYYQQAKVVGDKIYMALAPLKDKGNVYIFDSTKADANGFEKGATLDVTGEGFYIGIF